MNPERRLHILMITKWYPNRNDLQFGIFIRKHVLAVLPFADVTVFYAQSDDQVAGRNFDMDIQRSAGLTEYRVYYPRNNSFFAPVVNAWRYRKAFKLVWKKMRSENIFPDVLHAYILLRPGLLAWWMKRKYRLPYIVSEQWSGYATGKFRQRPAWIRDLYRFIYRQAFAGTAVSFFLKKNMERAGFPENIHVIPNTIEIQHPPVPHPEPAPSGTRILVVADLVDDIKNISGILRALVPVAAEFPALEMRIIGRGRDEKFLKNLAAELHLLDRHVFFEGVKSNEDVYRHLWKCDFLVMNSRFETFSLICAEAMSCGKPVIATRCGGPEEFVTPENGLLITPGVDTELSGAFRTMILKHKSYSPEKIRSGVEERFSPATAGRYFFRLYQEAVQSHRSR